MQFNTNFNDYIYTGAKILLYYANYEVLFSYKNIKFLIIPIILIIPKIHQNFEILKNGKKLIIAKNK